MSLLTDKLKELISIETHRPELKYSPGDKSARVLSVCSQKGGVGKTTTATSLGAALAQFFKQKVLICDLDPQGHVQKALASIVPNDADFTPLSTLLAKKKSHLMDAIIPTRLENLSITAGDKNLYDAETILSSRIGREFILQEALETAKTHYDWILFDCPPSLGNLTLNALVASDGCIVPCELSILAFEGVSDLVETLETVRERLNPKLELLGVVMTRVDPRNVTMNQVIEEQLKHYFKNRIFQSKIPINTSLSKAQLEGRPIFDFEPNSSGALYYRGLAEEILRQNKKRQSGT